MRNEISDWLALATRFVALGGFVFGSVTKSPATVMASVGLAGLPSVLGYHAKERKRDREDADDPRA